MHVRQLGYLYGHVFGKSKSLTVKCEALGGIELVECSTGMEWWNGIVE